MRSDCIFTPTRFLQGARRTVSEDPSPILVLGEVSCGLSSLHNEDFPAYSRVNTVLLPVQETLFVSNPLRYPGFRPSASGTPQPDAFAFGVPVDINGFHPYTHRSTGL